MFVVKLDMVNKVIFAHYNSNIIVARGENGGGCDVNTVLTN